MSFSQWWAFRQGMVDSDKDEAGVYELADAQERIVYIGSSNALRRRLTEHLAESSSSCIRRNATQYRIEYTSAYQRRERELTRNFALRLHCVDNFGCFLAGYVYVPAPAVIEASVKKCSHVPFRNRLSRWPSTHIHSPESVSVSVLPSTRRTSTLNAYPARALSPAPCLGRLQGSCSDSGRAA